MFEQVIDAVQTLQIETTTYPQGVQVWMKLMGISFLASILFVYNRVGARWILAALLLNLFGLVVGKMIFPDASRTEIGTFVHLAFWLPILWIMWRPNQRLSFARDVNSALDWLYAIWLCWASGLLAVSLVLDLRTAFSILSGAYSGG
jgi:hypothetical protein